MRSRLFDARAIRASDRRSHVLLAAFIVAVVLLSGCALRFQLLPGGEGEGAADDVGGSMTQSRLESIFADEVEAIVGPRGAIQARHAVLGPRQRLASIGPISSPLCADIGADDGAAQS